MAMNIIKTDKYETGFVHDQREEFLLDNAEDINSVPKDCHPGSIAYTADMSAAWQMSPNGEWVQIIGDSWRNHIS